MKITLEIPVEKALFKAGVYDFAELVITCRDGRTVGGWLGEASEASTVTEFRPKPAASPEKSSG